MFINVYIHVGYVITRPNFVKPELFTLCFGDDHIPLFNPVEQDT